MSAAHTAYRKGKRLVRQHGKSAGRKGGRSVQRDSMIPRQNWQLIQLVISGGLFIALVAITWFFPKGMGQMNEVLSAAMRRNLDVQEVFSAVGRAFAGEDGQGAIYQAVFGAETAEPSLQIEAGELEKGAAWSTLQKRQDPAGQVSQMGWLDETGAETLAYVLYSDQNLPENVSLEQTILGFEYCCPVSGVISSGFGYREHPTEGEGRFHYGVDLAADAETEIRSFADGTVTAAGESSSYGKYCIVTHENGYRTLYAHCSRITAASGKEVRKGQKIAEVGETGLATGPHLHFELQREGHYLNPVYYLEQA